MVLTRTALALAAALAATLGCGTEPSGPTFGPATRLAFSPQPVGGTAGQPMTVKVEIRDAQGRVVTTSTALVTVSLYLTPAGVMSGTTTQKAVAGVATFNDLVISVPGFGYGLVTTSGGLTQAVSNTFLILPGPGVTLAGYPFE